MSSPEQALRPAAAPRCLLGLRLSAFSAAPPSLHRQIRFGSSDGKVLGEEKDARKLTQIRFGSSGGKVLSSSGKAARCSVGKLPLLISSSSARCSGSKVPLLVPSSSATTTAATRTCISLKTGPSLQGFLLEGQPAPSHSMHLWDYVSPAC
ncbi:uncharacterized protein [Triticum aestivum]|uniref:uncharacterized protein isoform X2 n=1 Tax=Triticum aestivum TaxID=4565 RepID=UPI001D025DBD|nr:uncharacterized protein LOC123046942 isoform X2 [Triticum aestivum]